MCTALKVTREHIVTSFGVFLTVHNSIILVINQLNAQNLVLLFFIICLYMFRALCAHRQEVKIVLYSIWYHQTFSSLNLCTGLPPTDVMIAGPV